MKDFLKWLVIGPVVGLGLYFLSGKDIDINTDVLEKSVNAEDIFNQPSEDTGQSEIDALTAEEIFLSIAYPLKLLTYI